MRVIGTAGHVDHGKSSLVEALTGIHPDRLLEEQAREMTIDLGFAWLTLPHGETISIVDVPGHETFIKNMLAGVGGIDAALFVIAADEGIMPQTREHLAILDLLKISNAVIALTKTDLPFDVGWLELVQAEIRATIEKTALRDAEIIPVSAKTRRGLDKLQLALERALAQTSEKRNRARPRVPIDRVFTMSGFGTVVTGTLSDGALQLGDDVEIAPRAIRSRIRGLQAHKQKIESALPGQRVALNLANVSTDALARGDVVILPDTYNATTMLDAQIEWLPSAPKPLAHSQTLELFLYSAQVTARVRLLDADNLLQGQRAWAQLLLDAPLVAAKHDRFILRYPSPGITVGGGIIVEPHPHTRHKRNQPKVLERLGRALQADPAELVLQFVETYPAAEAREISKQLALAETVTRDRLQELVASGQVMVLPDDRSQLFIAQSVWVRWRDQIEKILASYHQLFPLRAGIPREELKNRLQLEPRVFDALVTLASSENVLRVQGKSIALATHRIVFDAATEAKVEQLLEQFARSPYNPPLVTEADAAIGTEALSALIEQHVLERVAPNVLFTPSVVAEMQAWVIETLRAQNEITAAQVRDHFGTSRKYAIALLEYLDAQHLTKRVGDARVLR